MLQGKLKGNDGRRASTSKAPALGIRCLLFGYRALFLVGVGLGLVYAIAPVLYERSLNGVLYAIVIVVLLLALRIAEGSEIAVTMVLNRDDEQLAAHPVGLNLKTVANLRENVDDFVSGRQLLVAIIVLAVGLTCTLLERAGTTTAGIAAEPMWLNGFLVLDRPEAYAFWFPIVAVLVFAQLPSKFAAQQHPMSFFAEGSTQFIIALSSNLARYLGLGSLMRRFAAPEEAPEPSRLQLYEAAAAFGNGLGLDEANISIVIDQTSGSVAYDGRFILRAYGRLPTARIPQDDFWDAEVSDCALTIEELPEYCGATTILGPNEADEAKTVHWDLAFAAPLKLHDRCVFRVRFRGAAGAIRIGIGESDYYSYDLERFPVKALTVNVTLEDASAIALREAWVEVDASLEKRVNEAEMMRVSRNVATLLSGYQYVVRFPLIGAKYKFGWQTGRRI
jgi:hypothetical protein